MYHKSVLLEEAVGALNITDAQNEWRRSGTYIDATFGGGGHSRKILEALNDDGRLIVFDKDEDARRNIPDDKRIIFIRNNFRFVANYAQYFSFIEEKEFKVDGIIADLGVSSFHFDTAERGFSYRFDAPLDMRMNRKSNLSAADIVNNYTREELAAIFEKFGEIGNAKAVANEIVRNSGNIETTMQLSGVLRKFYTPASEKKFLGKVFQALRIEVNREMTALEDLLRGCREILAPGGRIAIITYHSIEDRIVKNALREGKEEGIYKLINKKPILPDAKEIAGNGRSRSAKLRIAEKTEQIG